MRIDVLTIFPSMIDCFLQYGIIGRAIKNRSLEIFVHDLRDFTKDKHRQVDDQPYGGGAGMVMKPEPFFAGVRNIAESLGRDFNRSKRILMTPQGRILNQKTAKRFAAHDWILIFCGRYEGVDARVEDELCTDVVSVGDYILSGGETPAMVLIETISRLIPGVVGSQESLLDETFENGLLEYPQYTRPEVFENLTVPGVLLSGDHKKISDWRRQQSINRTLKRRPDLLSKADLTDEEIKRLSR
jgi:tRNA (guanine37-N1)-methyltransferase